MDSSYALGLSFIFLVAIIWSAASVLVQYLYQGLNFNSPFLLTYIGTSLFVILIPSRLMWEKKQKLCRLLSRWNLPLCPSSESMVNALDDEPIIIPWTTKAERSTEILRHVDSWELDESREMRSDIGKGGIISRSETLTSTRSRSFLDLQVMGVENTPLSSSPSQRSLSSTSDLSPRVPPPAQYLLSHFDHFRIAVKIAPLWFISNYFYNLSLAYTTITSSTVLSSTGSVFTFIFSLVCGGERFTNWKVLGVTMAVGGSIITSLQDASSSNDDENVYKYQLWGDAMGLISAIGYGGYTVLVRVLLPSDENRMSMLLFLGYIGLFNMLMLSPFLFWVLGDMNDTEAPNDGGQDGNPDYNGTQKLTMFVFMCVVVKGLIDNVISDYLWARSIILTSPTVATVGLGLTIPLALLSDVFIMQRGDILNAGSIFGAFLVLVGFVFVNLGEGDSEIEDTSSSTTTQDLDMRRSNHTVV